MFGALWNTGFAPHGYCLLWQPELIWTHIASDVLIAGAYFSIPAALALLVRRRRDLVFGWAFWCFAAFILLCGLTHVMGIWTMFQPVYGLQALVKAMTAVASVATAVLIWPLLPKAIALPSTEKLRLANAELQAMVRQRDQALADLREEIKQRERAEAALLQAKKLEAVGQLTGGIAHDFNNLLQAIGGNLELIVRRPSAAERVVRWATSASEALNRGRMLTGQLLAFSRKQRLALAPLGVGDMLEDARDLIAKAVAPLVQVRVEPIDPDLAVIADPLQLELALLNLAFNARDAMPEGGVITITARPADPEALPGEVERGDYVALTVSDTGEGMAPEVVARATEPFFTTKGVGRGTGIGLSTVFGMVTQSGGAMRIRSNPGAGTEVVLYLRAAKGGVAREERNPSTVESDLAGASILLVDDDADARQSVAETLRDAGAIVREAEDGAAGLSILNIAVPDLLVIDYAMPGLTGADVILRLREQHPTLPAIVITGFADSARLDAIGGERTLVLKKPFSRDEILQAAHLLLSPPPDERAAHASY